MILLLSAKHENKQKKSGKIDAPEKYATKLTQSHVMHMVILNRNSSNFIIIWDHERWMIVIPIRLGEGEVLTQLSNWIVCAFSSLPSSPSSLEVEEQLWLQCQKQLWHSEYLKNKIKHISGTFQHVNENEMGSSLPSSMRWNQHQMIKLAVHQVLYLLSLRAAFNVCSRTNLFSQLLSLFYYMLIELLSHNKLNAFQENKM